MKKTTLKTLAMSFVVAATLGVGALMSQPATASASTNLSMKAPNHTVTYHINSTSNYYHGMWVNAVKAWAKNDTLKFKEVAKSDNPQLTLSTTEKYKEGLSSHIIRGLDYTNPDKIKIDTSKVYLIRKNMRDFGATLRERTHMAERDLGYGLGLNFVKNDDSSSIMNYNYAYMNSITKTDLHNLAALYK